MKALRLGENNFFLSGEFHYFRVPRQYWADHLRLYVEAGLSCVSIYVPWNWHHFEPDNIDFTGSTCPERDLVGALGEIAKSGLSCVFRPGPFITAEWKNGGIPQWFIEQYPRALAISASGEPATIGAYPGFTYSHGAFRTASRQWIENSLEVASAFLATQSGPIINIQLDDEPSYFQKLVDPLALDYNPVLVTEPVLDGLTKYQAWLKAKYGSLNAIAEAYSSQMDALDVIEPPRSAMADKGELPRFLDWLYFKLDEINEYVKFLYDLTRNLAPEIGISMLYPYLQPQLAGYFSQFLTRLNLDLQLTNECYLSLNAPSVINEVKIGHIMACHEVYNMWRGAENGPPISMELQASNATHLSPGAVEILYAMTLSRGIRGVNFFMMSGGINSKGYENDTGSFYDISSPISVDGQKRPHYRVISKFSRLVRALEPTLLSGQVNYDTWLGCYRDYEASSMGGAAFLYDAWGHQVTFNLGDMGLSDAYSLPALLASSSVSFGCLDISSPTNPIDPSRISQLWVGALEFMSPGTQSALVKYVAEGGNLVIQPVVPTLDERARQCSILYDFAFGGAEDGKVLENYPVNLTNFVGYSGPWDEISLVRSEDDTVLVVPGLASELNLPAGSNPIAFRATDGKVCGFTRVLGKGQITVLGFRLQYSPGTGPGQNEFVRRLVGGSHKRDLVRVVGGDCYAYLLHGPRGGVVSIVNPTELSQVVRVELPAELVGTTARGLGEETISLRGRGAFVLPVNIDLTATGVTLRYSTLELVELAEQSHEYILGFDCRDIFWDETFPIPTQGVVEFGGHAKLSSISGGSVLSCDRQGNSTKYRLCSDGNSSQITLSIKS